MVELKFSDFYDPTALAYTETMSDLDTIYIPNPRKVVKKLFEKEYGFSPEVAQQTADVFLEEVYPDILAHETAHLVLGRIAAEEGKSPRVYSVGYDNPIVREIEEASDALAAKHAIEKVQKESRGLR